MLSEGQRGDSWRVENPGEILTLVAFHLEPVLGRRGPIGRKGVAERVGYPDAIARITHPNRQKDHLYGSGALQHPV